MLTWDMHLVEYELIVTPAESGDKISQVSDFVIITKDLNVKSLRLLAVEFLSMC